MRYDNTNIECDVLFTSSLHIINFTRSLECLCVQSDAGLLKVDREKLLVLVTDPDSFCISELRVPLSRAIRCRLKAGQVSFKVFIPDLVKRMREAIRLRQKIALVGYKGRHLRIKRFSIDSGLKDVVVDICKASNSMRVFHLLSKDRFLQVSDDYIHICMDTPEFSRIFNSHCILSAHEGGTGTFSFRLATTIVLYFRLKNRCGTHGEFIIRVPPTAEDVRILHRPTHHFQTDYLIGSIKRVQASINFPRSQISMYISEKGILFEVHSRHGVRLLAFVVNTRPIDLDSYAR